MRKLSFLISVAALISIGCSHEAQKTESVSNDTKATATAAATVTADKAKAAVAKVASTEGGEKVECSVKGDTRLIEVRTKGKGCELAYTKAGNEGIVASAGRGTEYCTKALERLRDKLKGAGYECK